MTIENLVRSGWRVIREWHNRSGNHWVLLTPEGRIWSGVDNMKSKSKAWRRLARTVTSFIDDTLDEPMDYSDEVVLKGRS